MGTKIRTGRTRHRIHKRWFRAPLLVLQYEYRYTGVDMVSEGGVVFDRPYDFKIWEDAGPYIGHAEAVGSGNDALHGEGE